MIARWRLAASLLLTALALPLAVPAAAQKKPLIDPKLMQRLTKAAQTFGGVRQAMQKEPVLSALERQRRGYGVVDQPQLDASLDQMLQELRRAAGPGAPSSRVYVTADTAFGAYASEEGSIFVPFAMLREMGSRDELAALLGHEYAHVLRNHSKRTALESSRKMLAGLSTMYLDDQYGEKAMDARRPEARYVRQALLRETAMQSVQAGLIPSRTREQEDEADRIGTDLLVAAGYNSVGMLDLLDHMAQWERMQTDAASARAREQGRLAGMVTRYSLNSDRARSATRKTGDKEITSGLVGLAVAGVGTGVEKLSRGHQDTGKRTEQVLAHIERKHANAPRPEMRPLPWNGDGQVDSLWNSLDQLHTLMGTNEPKLMVPGKEQDAMLRSLRNAPAAQTPLGRYVTLRFLEPRMERDKAMAGLQEELARSDSLYLAHELVLDLASRSGDRKQALALFETSRKSLGDPPELLRYGIRMNRRAGNMDAARVYAARCAGTGDDRIKEVCRSEL